MKLRISACSGQFAKVFLFRDQTDFYRATLCVSAVFAVVRCPSVCLSVTLMYCIQKAEDIVKHFSRPGSPMIILFDPDRRYPIPKEPIQWGGEGKIHEAGKFCVFRLKSPFISEMVRDRPVVTMELPTLSFLAKCHSYRPINNVEVPKANTFKI